MLILLNADTCTALNEFSSGVLAFQLSSESVTYSPLSEAFLPPLVIIIVCINVCIWHGIQMVVSNILNGGSRGKSLRFIMNSCVVYKARISLPARRITHTILIIQ
jgi:hypothetical protein